MGPARNIVQFAAEKPEADQSSALCCRILAVLEQHHQETLQRLDKLAAGRGLSHCPGNASLGLPLDCASADTHLDGSAELGSDLFGAHVGVSRPTHLDGSTEMGDDLFGTRMGLIETLTSPSDNDVPGHDGGMSPKGEVATKVSRQGSRASKGGGKLSRQASRVSKHFHGDGNDSEDSDDRRRRRLSEAGDEPSVGVSSADSADVALASPWRRRLRKMLRSTTSEVFIVITILANSLLIGAEVQYSADYPDSDTDVFINMNIAFTLLFLVELLVRTWVDGLRRFWRSQDWAWNMCDLIIVTTSLAEVVTNAWGAGNSTPTIMRVFRIARVGKALRIQRLIRFISALRTLVYSIFVTLRSLVWALILLLIIMYIFAIVIAQFSVEHIHRGTDVHSPRLIKFWGSLWASMLTLFQSITGGISWYEVTDALQQVSGLLVGVFIMYIFLITFAVFNVITGIFCHSAIETAVRDPDLAAQAELNNRKLYVQRVKKLFYDVDEDNSGVISLQELESVVKDEHVRAYFAALDLDLSDAWTIFKLIAGKADVIDQDTFVKGCLRLRGSARRQDCIATLTEMEALLRRFSSFAKITTQKMESLSALGGPLRPQSQDKDTSRISQWSRSVGSEAT